MILAAAVIASIYFPGDGLTPNHSTSSGQRYDSKRMACAHRTLRFGSRLYLSRGSNHAEVVINDRGPFVPGRSLDCTPAVDRALHLGHLGRVTMQPWPPLPKARPR